MNSDLRALYQEVILDHSKSPRNFREREDGTQRAEGHNPLCGDHITMFVETADNVIQDIAFQGSGCAISTASASMLTEFLKGKTVDEARAVFEKFKDMVTGDPTDEIPADPELGKLTVLSGVCEFPVRVKCATCAGTPSWLRSKGGKMSQPNDTEPAGNEPAANEPAANEHDNEDKTLREHVIDMIHTCYDPEIPVDIYELGLIYRVDVDEEGAVEVDMTLTSPACPVAGTLPPEVERKIESVEGVTKARVEVVWDPPWTPEMMTEAARLELGMF